MGPTLTLPTTTRHPGDTLISRAAALIQMT